MSKKVNGLAFALTLAGHGVVNYDGLTKKNNDDDEKKGNNNVVHAKGNWYTTVSEDGKNIITVKKPKISSYCLMNALFGEDKLFHSAYANSKYDKDILIKYYTKEMPALRGCFRPTEGIKRTASLKCHDAELSNNAVLTKEFFSSSGSRGKTSIFTKDTLGETEWETDGFFDIPLIQFLSCDKKFDNQGFLADDIEKLEKASLELFGRIPFKRGYYAMKNSAVPELEAQYGILYDSQWIKRVIKYAVKKMLDTKILRSNANAFTKKLKLCCTYCGSDIGNAMSNKNDARWVTITKDNYEEFIDSIEFDDFYQEVPEAAVINAPKDEQDD